MKDDTLEFAMLDLHLHLDGALTPRMAGQLAEVQGIKLPAEDKETLKEMLMVPADCSSLNDFLKCFELPLSLMQTEMGIRTAVELVRENIASQRVIYAEIRFAPQLHTRKGLTQEDVVKAALEGIHSPGCKTNLILCCMRGADNEEANAQTLELAKKYLVEDEGVVALDLAGAEALFPTRGYRELFARAKEYGIPFTIHAGEADGAESVRLAVEYGAARIGHGTRSYEDPEVMKLLQEKGIFLEMCPTSNRMTHAVPDMRDFPLISYLDRGIRVTLNTDDMGIEGITLRDEFRYIKESFDLTEEQRRILILNAIDAAFTSDEVKSSMRRIFNSSLT